MGTYNFTKTVNRYLWKKYDPVISGNRLDLDGQRTYATVGNGTSITRYTQLEYNIVLTGLPEAYGQQDYTCDVKQNGGSIKLPAGTMFQCGFISSSHRSANFYRTIEETTITFPSSVAAGSQARFTFSAACEYLENNAVYAPGTEQGYCSYTTNKYPDGDVYDGVYYEKIGEDSLSVSGQYDPEKPRPGEDFTFSFTYPESELPVPISATAAIKAGNTTYASANQTKTITVPEGVTSLYGIMRFSDQYGFSSNINGPSRIVELAPAAPALSAPNLAMQGQDIPISWGAVNNALEYVLERKSDLDVDWVQIYSGTELVYTEVAGAWSNVQYRVKAKGEYADSNYTTSSSIPVVSDSALVISGQDGDLGTLVNDVPYTISTDTGNQITVRTTVNGFVILEGTVPSGTAEHIPVLDLVHGNGTIVIEASVETDGGTVSAARIWTYNKAAMTFPNAGSPAQLTKEGKTIWPKTLAECVRLPGGRTLEEVMGFPCQIYVGRYTGTGTYGSGDPNEVTVPFKPQAVFVTSGSVGTTIPMIRPCTSAKNSSATLTVTWEDDGVSWYSTSAANQLNAAGTTYDIVAFG